MIVSNADIWRDYREINEDLELTGDRALSNDSNIEDPALIVGVRKWSWEGCSSRGPDFSSLGLTMVQHVRVFDKYDIFIYERSRKAAKLLIEESAI